jgi:hypothetical protein
MTAAHTTPGEGSRIPDRSGVAARFVDACLYCVKPARLRRTVMIALVVGTILTLLNLGDVILGGNANGATAVKAALNYVVPFVVSNLGMLSGRGTTDAGDE